MPTNPDFYREHDRAEESPGEMPEGNLDHNINRLRENLRGGVPINMEPEKSEQNPDKLPLPERNPEAMTGTQFAEYLENLEKQLKQSLRTEGKNPNEIMNAVIEQREQAMYEQIMSGNVPDHMRKFKNVDVEYTNPQTGENIQGSIRVLPDYLMVGSGEDAIRITMTPELAQRIARGLGCTLPTDTMVDAISAEARAHGKAVQPHAMPGNKNMDSIATLAAHNRIIEEKLGDYEGNPLIDGVKKDIILPYGNDGKGRVVIYGMHYKDGTRIQNYSKIHHGKWVDYSHGVRLVSGTMTIRNPDGTKSEKKVSDVLTDPLLYRLIARNKIQNPGHQYNESPRRKDEDEFLV